MFSSKPLTVFTSPLYSSVKRYSTCPLAPLWFACNVTSVPKLTLVPMELETLHVISTFFVCFTSAFNTLSDITLSNSLCAGCSCSSSFENLFSVSSSLFSSSASSFSLTVNSYSFSTLFPLESRTKNIITYVPASLVVNIYSLTVE